MNIFSTKIRPAALDFGLLLLRFVFGSTMIMNHGYKKLVGFNTMKEKFMDFMGLGPTFSLSLTIFAEVFCAALLMIGLFTRFAALVLLIAMTVALFMAHNGEIFGDGESAALFMVAFLFLMLVGPGRYSIDNLISKGK